ncbi:hypothetical protein DU086_23595 [Salmonella enterica subsp. enterica serovar Manhattan]|nr:hypothetical protein [Salmonella enterica subsp. enterica serovar Manhattan]
MSGPCPDQDILECPRRVGGTPKTHLVPSLASPKLSQYTLRYRYVTGSGLRPDTRKGQNQKRLAGGCAHCVITTTRW